MRSNTVTDEEVADALECAHRIETSVLLGQVARLTAVIRAHDLPVPGEDTMLDGLEHLQACREVVMKAYELLEAVETLRTIVGSGAELLCPPWRKQ